MRLRLKSDVEKGVEVVKKRELRILGLALFILGLLSILGVLNGCSKPADAVTNTATNTSELNTQGLNMSKPLSLNEVNQIFGKPAPFNLNRTADELRAKCTRWQHPEAPDAASERWYKTATTLDAIRFKSAFQHQYMLILYEGAARRGHYKAIYNLITIYTEGALVREGDFMPEPQKARAWLDYGLRKGWVGALEWLSFALYLGIAGHPQDNDLSMAYLQQAADLGVAAAQYQLSTIYGNAHYQMDKEDVLLECAAQQDYAAALYHWGATKKIRKHPEEALVLYQRAIMQGGKSGTKAAYLLGAGFSGAEHHQKALSITTDKDRGAIYEELNIVMGGNHEVDANVFYKFPRLNEVLPLPPAEMPEWKGIYSAMSKEDAEFYQNPPDPVAVIREVKDAGYIISEEYLSKLVPDEPEKPDEADAKK